MLNSEIVLALWVTVKLALLTTIILLALGVPFSWWLSSYEGRWKAFLQAIIAMPLVLPPTVLGFYLLIAFSPDTWLGQFWLTVTGSQLAFSFSGILLGSIIYSLPFMLQPLLNSFNQLSRGQLEAVTLLGYNQYKRFIFFVLPACRAGVVNAIALTFAHTLGEFGVVLMIGGSVAGETRLLSIALFEQVETLQYAAAHQTAGVLFVISLLMLLLLYSKNKKAGQWI